MFRVIVLATAICGLFAQSGKAAEFRANYVEIAALLRAALKDAEIHLNNKPNPLLLALVGPKQSYVKIGNVEIPVEIPAQPVWGTNYYVHQVVSTKITVAAVKQAVRVSVNFKAEGPEGASVVANSVAVPWVRWLDGAMEIDFKPIKVAKGISFEVTRVAMQGPFVAFCPPNDAFSGFACDLLSLTATKQQMARVRSKVELSLKEYLNKPQLRDQVAETVTKYLSFAKTDDIDIRIRDVKAVADGVVVSFCVNRC